MMMSRLLKRFAASKIAATNDCATSKKMGGESGESIARRECGFSVAPSPLNPVKFELALIVVVGGLLWLLQDTITGNAFSQLLLLLGYGVCASAWLTWRVRRIVAETAQAANMGPPSECETECRDEK
ncbi:MAG: hypothetical protein GXP10_11530 [Gammaproteobacteria bacterium]|nr:hypothetical protein [Gammaproteobacteria bacterium]